MSFTKKHPSSRELFGFEYAGRLPVGVTISSAAVTIRVLVGEDVDSSSMLDGSPVIVGSKVSQAVEAGVLNTQYCLDCLATCSDGQIIPLVGQFWVIEFCTEALITFDDAKSHLLVGHDYSDVDIESKAMEASAIVLDYLKLSAIPVAWGDADDSPPGTGVPYLVRAATKLVLGELFDKREAGGADVLSDGVKSLLRRYRDPALQ